MFCLSSRACRRIVDRRTWTTGVTVTVSAISGSFPEASYQKAGALDSSARRRHIGSAGSGGAIKTKESSKNWGDPVARQYKFWNPQSKNQGQYSFLIDMSPESLVTEAKIISLSDPDDPANVALHHNLNNNGTSTSSSNNHSPPPLPLGAALLGVGTTLEQIQTQLAATASSSQPNVLFVSPSCPSAATVLPQVLRAYPSISWIHVRSAGIDFIESDDFAAISAQNSIAVTNAKGQFSSSLAEYALAACSYFAKDFRRLTRQQEAKEWINYDIEDLYVEKHEFCPDCKKTKRRTFWSLSPTYSSLTLHSVLLAWPVSCSVSYKNK